MVTGMSAELLGIVSNLGKFLVAVDEYQAEVRHPSLERFLVSLPYDYFPERGPVDFAVSGSWPAPWPNGDRAGVYVFLSEELKVVHVGKASLGSSFNSRLGTYTQYRPGRQGCVFVHGWKVEPRFVVTVSVPESSRFEAVGLEEFLLGRLVTSDNTLGARRLAATSAG